MFRLALSFQDFKLNALGPAAALDNHPRRRRGEMLLSFGFGFATLLHASFASPVQRAQPRPLVIWHGLGDSYGAPGMLQFIEAVKGVHPGLFVHSVHLADSQQDDKKAGFVSTPSAIDASDMCTHQTPSS